MTVYKGGRGIKAPYKTTLIRIPIDIKERVKYLSQAFKEGSLSNESISLDKAIEVAEGILNENRSLKLSLENLLTVIYGKSISL